MEELREAQTALRRSHARLEDELDDVKRKKASREDLAAVSEKYSALETETRNAIGSIKSDVHDIRDFMRRISDRLDETETTVTKQKSQVNELRGSAGERSASGVSVWERLPKWAYLVMGVGALALLQQGPAMWSRLAQTTGVFP